MEEGFREGKIEMIAICIYNRQLLAIVDGGECVSFDLKESNVGVAYRQTK